ncbi:MAG: redoxin domain-containing protein [Planctomycetales bacterium]|nr:redoxin domain-containing protein [Planctomycetales bacterium]
MTKRSKLLLLFFGCCGLSLSMGCGGDQAPITAADRFSVKSDSDSADVKQSPDAGASTADATSDAPPREPFIGVPAGSRSGSQAAPVPGLPPTSPPPGDPADELLAAVRTPIQPPQNARSQREMLEVVLEQIAAKIKLVERVLAMKTTPENRLLAANMKLGLMSEMVKYDVPDAQKHVKEFCKALESDPQADIARLGRMLHTSMLMGDYEAKQDFAPIRERLEAALKDPSIGIDEAQGFAQAGLQLLRTGAVEEGRQVIDMLLAAYKDKQESDPQLKMILEELPEQARVLEVGFTSKRDQFLRDSGDGLKGYMETTRNLLTPGEKQPGFNILQAASQAASDMERAGKLGEAKEVYGLIADAYKDREDAEIRDMVKETIDSAHRRLDLVGAKLDLKGTLHDGKPLDPGKYAGQHLLIHFWSPQSLQSMQEFEHVMRIKRQFGDRKLSILGVAVGSTQEVKQFFSLQELPWDNIIDSGGDDEFTRQCGVMSLPFSIFVTPDGVVDSLYVMAPEILTKLEQTLPKAEPAAEPAKSSEPKEAEEVRNAPAPPEQAEAPSAPNNAPPARDGAHSRRASVVDSLVGFDDPPAKPAPPQADAPAEKTADKTPADKTPAENAEGNDPPSELELAENPYLPREGLSTRELIALMLDMEDRPKSIRARPGFQEAIVIAAERVLEDKEAKESIQLTAIESKFWALHTLSVADNEAGDKQLKAYVDEMKDDTRKRVGAIVEFMQIERRVLDADNVELDSLPDLLEEAMAYCEANDLNERHLRFASSVVHAINRLEEAEEREEWFKGMGGLFAKSDDRQLSRYGKRIAQPKAAGPSSAVGKEMELAGTTVPGLPFDWTRYKGKVVIVDFWATWCGPCVREMPNVKAFYQKHHGDGLELVGVSLDKDLDAVANFVAEKKIPWETLVGDENQDLATKYGVRGIPTLMLVDRTGKIVAAAHNIAGIAKKAEELLANKQ